MTHQALGKQFASDTFHPEKFVKDLSSQCIGADELRQQRAKIQELSDSTSALLKRNVYQNYIQFIETAKEISHLESEMYQLSQLLCDQRSLLSVLGTNQSANVVFDDPDDDELLPKEPLDPQEESKQKLVQLLENVEGAMSLVDTPGRVCLHEGSLLELDALEGLPLKRVHAYLFNDILMVASWLANSGRRGSQRYRMQAVYDLQSLAVVNVRDLGSVKLAFKLLAFPDTRVFQCATATSKKEWLEKCDLAKKQKSSQPESINEETSTKASQLLPTSRSVSVESNGMVVTIESEEEYTEPLPEWILEISEDLDSCIAQRHYEEAYNLLEKAKIYFGDASNNSQSDIQAKLDEKAIALVSVLTKELESSTEAKSLQGGGLRSARRAVRLLMQLGHSAQACQLYLRLCSVALKARLKRVKREGSTVAYVKQLSAIAFSNIADMAREFLKNFPQDTNCNSALLVWCSHEIKLLASHLEKQIFIPQVSLSTLVECIVTIRNHCDQLAQLGMDFRCQLDNQLRAPLSRALQETGDKYVDAVKVRAAEDVWKPCQFDTTQNFHKLQAELDDLGIALPDSYVKNEHSIPLTHNTLAFSKLYVGLLEDCLNAATPEIVSAIEGVLISVLQVQVQHLQSSLANPRLKQERKLVLDNARYIHDVIIARSLDLHKSVTGHRFERLLALQKQLAGWEQPTVGSPSKPRPAPRTSVPKYSTTEYI